MLTFSPPVLHYDTEDRVQQTERLFDCTVWHVHCAVCRLRDAADVFTRPARLVHHLDGCLMTSGEKRLWPSFCCVTEKTGKQGFKVVVSTSYIWLF